MKAAPDKAVGFAHAVTEAHYGEGMDPNDPEAYLPLLAEHAPGVTLPDIHDPVLAEAAFADGRRMGIASYPSFLLEKDGRIELLPTIYDPDQLVADLQRRIQ